MNRRILLKLENSNYINQDYTHLIIKEPIENIDLIKELYILKTKNRYIKILYEVDINTITETTKDSMCTKGTKNIKSVIKSVINYCADGIIFKNIQYDKIIFVHNIIDIIEKLPQPYNFKWEFFIQSNDMDIILDLFRLFKSNNNENVISGIITNYEYIKILTDNGFKPDLFIIDDKITDKNTGNENYKKINKMGIIYVIKMNKLGGICTDNLYNLGNELLNIKDGLISGIKENHIDYPTSDIVKIIEVEDIINLYNYDKFI